MALNSSLPPLSAPSSSSSSRQTLDAEQAQTFRQALGSFTTGVTIVTASHQIGQAVEMAGLTVNSFNSVSLSPPLVLWSIARKSLSWKLFEKAGYWAVHILAHDQEALANRFAQRGTEKFAGLTLEMSEHGVPLLAGCAARMECKAVSHYEGGDHIILVGEVVRFEHADRAPLVYQRGAYAFATRKPAIKEAPAPVLAASAGVTPALDETTLPDLLRQAAHDLSAVDNTDDEAAVLQALGPDAALLRTLLERVRELTG